VNKVGILLMLQALPGEEADVEQFLKLAGPLVEVETGTTRWFAFKVGTAIFGIFDTFKPLGLPHVPGIAVQAALLDPFS
jgi:hypothetical protein